MSRYGMDKALRRLIHDREAKAALASSPDTVLDGCDLDAEERRALAGWDVGTLYRLGAHPFLLWNAFSNVGADREGARGGYLDAISPYGYPEFTT